MPVYAGTISTADWDTILDSEITNRVTGANGSGGLRSFIQVITLADISGRRVGIMAKEGERVEKDIVTIVGCTNTDLIVKFDDDETEYSVKRSQVRLVLGVE